MSNSENRTGEGKYPLRVLMWESTLRCNAFCEFCGSSCGERDISDELSADEIRGLFKKISQSFDASGIMINVTGGEPLLRKDLPEIMEYAVSLGYKWGLVTNGTLLTPETVEKLRKARASSVSVSIDGLFGLHDRVRRLPGALDRIEEGLHLLTREQFLDHLMVTTVVSRRNIHQLEDLKEYLKNLPIDIWRIGLVDPIGRARENDSLLLTPQEIKRTLSFIRECRREDLPFTVTTSCSHYLGSFELQTRDYPFHCLAGKQMASILADGSIYVCTNVPRRPELIQGNIRTDDFADVWKNRFDYFRDPFARKKNKCAECAGFPLCRGDSLHTWDFDKEAPLFCFLEKDLQSPPGPGKDIPEASFEEVIDKYRVQGKPLRAKKVRALSLSRDKIILSPKAISSVFSFFRWGQKADSPSSEQMACLLGRLYREKGEEETFLAEVCALEECHPLYSGPDFITADPGLIEEAREAADKKGLSPLGFIHSHPGPLTIAMSLGDCRWHSFLFQSDWKMALNIILNPQKQEIAAYAGPAASHAELILIMPGQGS